MYNKYILVIVQTANEDLQNKRTTCTINLELLHLIDSSAENTEKIQQFGNYIIFYQKFSNKWLRTVAYF